MRGVEDVLRRGGDALDEIISGDTIGLILARSRHVLGQADPRADTLGEQFGRLLVESVDDQAKTIVTHAAGDMRLFHDLREQDPKLVDECETMRESEIAQQLVHSHDPDEEDREGVANRTLGSEPQLDLGIECRASTGAVAW